MTGAAPFPHPSASLAEALDRTVRVFSGNIFDNIVLYAVSVAILVGAWVAAYAVSALIWYLGMFNWRRLCGCSRAGSNKKTDVEWNKPFNDKDESANKPAILPVPATMGARFGQQPRLRPIAAVAAYKTQEVKQSSPTENRWHGHPRSRYENYLRLVTMSVRVFIIAVGVILSFQSAGVNILSLAASIGIVSICFSVAASSMLSNILSAIYMYGTDKLEMGDYIQVAGVKGVVTAFRAQWTEITDDLSPWNGRAIHQIPNRVPMDTVVTVFPDGPPSSVVKGYFADLEAVNTWRASSGIGLPPLVQVNIAQMIGRGGSGQE